MVKINRNTVKYSREFLFTDFHGRSVKVKIRALCSELTVLIRKNPVIYHARNNGITETCRNGVFPRV
jgi:hypothetical protein